jgi:hypothetical protein
MKLILSALALTLSSTAFGAYDCHLARTSTQDSEVVFHSCNTGEASYEAAANVCQALCTEGNACETFYVNTYAPVANACVR